MGHQSELAAILFLTHKCTDGTVGLRFSTSYLWMTDENYHRKSKSSHPSTNVNDDNEHHTRPTTIINYYQLHLYTTCVPI